MMSETTIHKQHDQIVVVDIGGTYARFAIHSEDGTLSEHHKFERQNFPSFAAVFSAYQEAVKNKHPKTAARIADMPISLAIAANPIDKTHWRFSSGEEWGLHIDDQFCSVISDLQAYALGAVYTDTHVTLRKGKKSDDTTFSATVIAVGTGLGLSYIQNGHAQKTHGGHMRAFGVSVEQNTIIRIIERLSDNERMVIYEDLCSGSGLSKLYQAVCIYHGQPVLHVHPKDILEQADQDILNHCLRLFHEFLGLFAHMAIVFGHGYGGLYLGGGVIDVLIERGLFDQEVFFNYLNQDAQKSVAENLENTAVYLISEKDIALYGAAISARQIMARNNKDHK